MNNRKNRVSVLTGLLAAVLLLSLLSGMMPHQASAASSSEIKVQIRELKEEKEALVNMMARVSKRAQAFIQREGAWDE